MEKFIRKTTREYFKDAEGVLTKEIETIEEYTVSVPDTKILDGSNIKSNVITSDKISCHATTEKQLNPDLVYNGDIGDGGTISAGTISTKEIKHGPVKLSDFDEPKKSKELEAQELEKKADKIVNDWLRAKGVPSDPYSIKFDPNKVFHVTLNFNNQKFDEKAVLNGVKSAISIARKDGLI